MDSPSQKDSKQTTLFRLAISWVTIAGKDMARSSAPIRLEKDTLTIAVDDPTLLFQCKMLQNSWRAKVNQHLGSDIIKRTEFRLMQ